MKERFLTIILSVATTFGLMRSSDELSPVEELHVNRLIVHQELIVSDTGRPWEDGYEEHQIPRGVYARPQRDGTAGGLWVRGRLIKGEIDDPFDGRFHALERDGSLRKAPGHISWNVWLDGAWRQMAILQGEGLEYSEVPRDQWNGATHPGRLRLQSFRPSHAEPLTDALIGQGKMSIGGGGYGGGGLPFPDEVLELWGGELRHTGVRAPDAPTVVRDDGTGAHEYTLVAVGPQGLRSTASKATRTNGLATLQWDSVPGADSYIILRDDQQVAALRAEGSRKEWADEGEK